MILEANPDYYGDAPKMRQVTILFMEEDAAFAAVRAGQVDVAYTAASYADQSVPEFSLLDCETVDNRGFNLPAVPETVREDGVKIGNDFTCLLYTSYRCEDGDDAGSLKERRGESGLAWI